METLEEADSMKNMQNVFSKGAIPLKQYDACDW